MHYSSCVKSRFILLHQKSKHIVYYGHLRRNRPVSVGVMNMANIIADINLASQTAMEQSLLAKAGGNKALAYGLQMRRALIEATINSMSGKVETGTMLTLVSCGVWGVRQGMAVASRVTEPIQRADGLTQLFAMLPKEQRAGIDQVALQAISELQSDHPKSRKWPLLRRTYLMSNSRTC